MKRNTKAKRIFLAGASGAIGRRLSRLLVEDGHAVTGTTRTPSKAAALAALGVNPVVVDVFDAESLRSVLAEAHPDIVIHQLTDLPPGLDSKLMADARIRNVRLRDVGTANLVAAAVAAGVTRIIAQSIAFAYAPGSMPYDEAAPLNVGSTDAASVLSARAVASLERQVMEGPFVGVVLRYGKLYGPGTGFDVPPTGGPVHVDAAADAARRATACGGPGIYNVAEEDGAVSSAKAKAVLGWDPLFRIEPETV